MNKQVKKPNVVRGGIAIPLGRNYYYMAGRKHKNGGIDIGKNPRTGLEVEDGEVMHISDKNVKVFSSVPFLNGKSPAQKVLGGENPDTVFNQQETFKDRNGINDDGSKKQNVRNKKVNKNKAAMGTIDWDKIDEYADTAEKTLGAANLGLSAATIAAPNPYTAAISTYLNFVDPTKLNNKDNTNNKKAMGGLSRSKDYKPKSKSYSKEGDIYSVTVNGKTKMRMFPSTGSRTKAPFGIDYKLPDIIGINPNENDKYVETMLEPINKLIYNTRIPYTVKQNNPTNTKKHNLFSSTKNPFKMTKGDTISLAANVGGSLISAGINALALKNLKAPSKPIAAPASKLKTRININPQLDKMRETIAEYERNVDNNTLSSRVALARKQNARLAGILQTNELYGEKENKETELINADKLNQQAIAAENIKAYNDWRDRVNAFENEIVDKKSENLVSMIGNINQGLQDVVSRNEQRDAERQTRLAMSAAHPNVNPRILKALGIKGITDEDIARWEKAFYNKK